MKGKTLVIDLDGTICEQMDSTSYAFAKPREKVVAAVNQFRRQGGKVVVHTARGMNLFDGDLEMIERRFRPMTELWLKDAGVGYDKLVFGKPAGDIYVDDKGESVQAFVDRFRQKVVFTNGCFDVLHRGHLFLLQECRRLAGSTGKVVVGLNSDESVRRLKGDDRPVNSFEHRESVLTALRFVDEVVKFTEDTPLNLITRLKPDLIVKGSDYNEFDVVGRWIPGAERPISVHIVPLVEGLSSTNMIESSKR